MKTSFRTTTAGLLLAAAATAVFSGLQYHVDTLLFNQGIVMTTTPEKVDFDEDHGTAVCDSLVDFIYRNSEICCLAIGCNCGLRFESPGELYLSTVQFVETVFAQPLAVNSLVFTPAITDSTLTCPDFRSFTEPGSMSALPYENYERAFFVIRNSMHQYAVAKIRYIPQTFLLDPPYPDPRTTEGVIDRIEIAWWLQTDGSLDFSGLGSMRAGSRQTVHPAPLLRSGSAALYTVKGEKAPANLIYGRQYPAGIRIIATPGGGSAPKVRFSRPEW